MSEMRTFRRQGLGRGLDALLSPNASIEADDPASAAPEADSPDGQLVWIDPGTVDPNPEQPRKTFDEDQLDALGESIRVHGLLHPIVVQRDQDRLVLVAGERRLRASQRAGVTRIPALVRPAAESARHALEIALTENLQRTDLLPLEEAAAYARLADTFGLSHEAIGLRVGRSRSAVANSIRLLSLSAPVQQALAEGRISAGHARALLPIHPLRQEDWVKLIEDRGLSVRAIETAIQSLVNAGSLSSFDPRGAQDRKRRRAVAMSDPDQLALQRAFEEALGLPVEIQRRRRGGGRPRRAGRPAIAPPRSGPIGRRPPPASMRSAIVPAWLTCRPM